ncbi:response regulator [Paracidobacterium acidisoli]|uniref:Response regulator n=1 Tax=Paracidobacterium acidisoli TaxID=2303751 RepID=A0A372IM63_9BACT|nr:response regulator [Paracidobacterium acidisoli]MBT9331642.1 response regulator [Paracidobacterium acidisoli]
MERRILLVDDELAILLTLKAVLEISGFEVETAASAREAKSKIKSGNYHMVITDMRMESENAGLEVVRAARKAIYRPAVAMLTAFPLSDSEWRDEGADEMLVKPMNTEHLLRQIEALLVMHEDKKRLDQQKKLETLVAAAPAKATPRKPAARKAHG